MCGRYWIDDGRESIELQGIIEQVNRRVVVEPVKTSGEIFPSDTVPVLATSRSRTPGAFPMQWGYTLPDGKRIINARSETAADKPMFRDGMRQRRCAVPASRYFEWDRHSSDRTKYAIQPVDGQLFYMAGIYRIEDGRPVFSILTRNPADNIAFIHNRMPVILPGNLVGAWIDPGTNAEKLLERAVLSVDYRRTENDEQLKMDI